MSESTQHETLSEIQLLRLQELKRQWWELDAEILLRPTYTEAEQRKIEDEILEIVLGVRE